MANQNDYLKRAIKQKWVLTKFLDTAEASELRLIKSHEINCFFYGGIESSERVRCILQDKNIEEPSIEEFEIKVLVATLSSNIRPVTHRHVLGTLMSFGIKRETIGDIFINDNKVIIFVVSEMVNFIKNNLIEINHISVSVEETDISSVEISEESTEKTINVASLRLDAIVSRVENISRNDSASKITKGLVQVNHIECLNTSYNVKMNDLISIRHFGRVEILEIVKTTKKDRLVVLVNIKH